MPSLLTWEERNRQLNQLALVSTTASELTDDMLRLAHSLSLIHGQIRVANEKSGIHFYLASPICLLEDGAIELDKMHLAVNVSKYVAGEDFIAQCMKTGTAYNIMDLVSMPPLSKRGYEDKPEVIRHATTRPDYLEEDVQGNVVPKGPGKVTPVFKLPADHPAQVYVKRRGFDAIRLYQQFRLSYGEEERTDMFYRRMLNGFRATPQGRLIFFIDIDGVQKGWQARIIEADHDGFRYYWHPYRKAWMKVLQYSPNHPKKWVPVNESWQGWDSVKYVTSHGARRNECLMGFDAAVCHKRRHGSDFCFLMEGPLDAARLGPPAMSLVGKSVSRDQIKLTRREFSRIVYIPDTDAAGQDAKNRTIKLFSESGCLDSLIVADLPVGKDLGEMSEQTAKEFAYGFLQ